MVASFTEDAYLPSPASEDRVKGRASHLFARQRCWGKFCKQQTSHSRWYGITGHRTTGPEIFLLRWFYQTPLKIIGRVKAAVAYGDVSVSTATNLGKALLSWRAAVKLCIVPSNYPLQMIKIVTESSMVTNNLNIWTYHLCYPSSHSIFFIIGSKKVFPSWMQRCVGIFQRL